MSKKEYLVLHRLVTSRKFLKLSENMNYSNGEFKNILIEIQRIFRLVGSRK